MKEPCTTAVIFTGGFCDTAGLFPHDIRADLVIAADAGQHTASACGVVPDILAGDFDSSAVPHTARETEIIRVPAEKDDTDTMLACDIAIRHGARRIRILGGTGGRLDHTLSNVFLLEHLHRRGVRCEMTDGVNRITVIENESITLVRGRYRYFSLLALDAATVSIVGGKYPLQDAPLTREMPYAVSNEITEESATVTVRGGAVFLLECEREPTRAE